MIISSAILITTLANGINFILIIKRTTLHNYRNGSSTGFQLMYHRECIILPRPISKALKVRRAKRLMGWVKKEQADD